MEEGVRARLNYSKISSSSKRVKQAGHMTMQDWAEQIDKFLLADDRDILKKLLNVNLNLQQTPKL